ncbi:expressed protein [Phakopsora pachyrhizi]|uniref:Expressed protein n=1 Tax=Phakopsora pachyrhizi TaxID=170000 RepID=A0AAV0AIS4_PHAPC|nr:expressed protein [Phakopsora pachyrhizi]
MNDTGKFNFSNFFNNSSPGLSILKDSRNQLKEQSSNEAEMVQGKKGNFESRLQKSCNDDKDEQRRLFSGFTHLPSLPNQFDLIDQEEKYLIINQLKSSLKSSTASSISTSSINSTNQRRSSIKKSNYCDDYRFVTPIRVVPGTSRYDRRGSVGSSSSGINNNGEQQRSFHNSNYNTQLCGSSSNRKRRINEELRVPMSQFEELTRLIDHVQLTAKKSRQTARGCFERSDDKIISRIGQIDFSRIDERRDMVDDECLEERVEVNNDNSLCEDVLDGDKNRSDEDKGEVYERLENRCKSLIRKVDRLICRSEEFYDKVSKTDF